MGGHDTAFLLCVGLAVVAAQYAYAFLGWACPILIRKSQVREETA